MEADWGSHPIFPCSSEGAQGRNIINNKGYLNGKTGPWRDVQDSQTGPFASRVVSRSHIVASVCHRSRCEYINTLLIRSLFFFFYRTILKIVIQHNNLNFNAPNYSFQQFKWAYPVTLGTHGYIRVRYRWIQQYPYLYLSTDTHAHTQHTHRIELQGPG